MANKFLHTSFFAKNSNYSFSVMRRLLHVPGQIKQTKIDLEDIDKPIEYLKSNAANWRAQTSRRGGIDEAPWFQTYIISGSLTVFMIYFFYLREENDIDLQFQKSLGDRIEGIEERQLIILLEYNKHNSLPTEDIEKKLKEINSNKQLD